MCGKKKGGGNDCGYRDPQTLTHAYSLHVSQPQPLMFADDHCKPSIVRGLPAGETACHLTDHPALFQPG